MSVHPLQSFRKKHNPPLSRAKLAKMLGVKRATVHRWETGKRQPEGSTLKKISKKTGIPVAELRPDLAQLLQAAE